MVRNRPTGRRTCQLCYTQVTIHASYGPKPLHRGDGLASYDTRELRPTRDTIRNRLLGAINLPAMTHTTYDPKPPTRGDTPASYETRKLRSTRDVIRKRLLGAINLRATIHANCFTRYLCGKLAKSAQRANPPNSPNSRIRRTRQTRGSAKLAKLADPPKSPISRIRRTRRGRFCPPTRFFVSLRFSAREAAMPNFGRFSAVAALKTAGATGGRFSDQR